VRTSETDPIRVDFLPRAARRLPGRIGLTFAPGKRDPVFGWNRDLGADLRRLRDHYGVRLLVPLVEDHELALLGIEALVSEAQEVGLRVHRLPIRDVDVPTSTDEVVVAVRVILAAATAGDTVVIHCRGGLGRAGTLGSCCLVALGRSPRQAVHLVRSVRPGAVEMPAQELFVESFAEAWAASGDPRSPVVPGTRRQTG
jgi:protein-tyrosine phosphatase